MTTDPLSSAAPRGTGRFAFAYGVLAMLLGAMVASSVSIAWARQQAAEGAPASVIFIHPDGTGVNTWGACRMLYYGPDGDLNWDRLPNLAVYRGHLKDALAATSHGGGTVHAYGVKVQADSFGKDGTQALASASGAPMSVMAEAIEKGFACGVISTAAVVDAGTGVFLASVDSRDDKNAIALQMLARKPNLILGGGEQFFLPKGVKGRHGEGVREDGLDLVKRALGEGYTVVYTRDELASLPAGTTRLLGLFASDDTFNDKSEEELAKAGLPHYVPTAPSIAEMLAAGLRVLKATERPFFVVAEEEGTDNFAGANNARATLDALKRADDAIGVALGFIEANPRTLVLTAADSDCSGMQVRGEPVGEVPADKPLPARDEENGSPIDGRDGTGTLPFIAGPDRFGTRLPFGICWAAQDDMAGGIVARAAGWNAERVRGTIDNTGIYAVIRETLIPGAK